MGRPKSTSRLRRLIAEQEVRVTQILSRLVEAEEMLASETCEARQGLVGRLVGARRGQCENAESKLERLKDELASELVKRAARKLLIGPASFSDTENVQ